MAPPRALALAPRFSIGRTLSLTFAVLWRNLGRMSVVALAVSALQVAIEIYVQLPEDSYASPLISFVAALILFALVSAPVSFATLQSLRGHRITIADMLVGGLRRVVRVFIGATLWLLVLLAVPIALLVVGVWLHLPGILLAGTAGIYLLAILAIWFVVVPVLVAEDVRLLSSFRRSGHLTGDHRWGVLALVLLLAAMAVAMVTIAMSVRLALIAHAPMPMVMYPWASLAIVPLGAFSSLMTGIVPAVAYHLLQAEKEGGGVEVLARVFE